VRTTIGKTYHFDAAHWLPLVATGHKCRAIHGHTYHVEVEVEGYDESTGMVVDFAALDSAVNAALADLDHTTLNNFLPLDNPTVEVVSRYLLAVLSERARVVAVTVREGDGGWARTCS